MNVLKGFTKDHWFSPRLNALLKAVKSTPEKKFIWAIGGASDLTESVSESQIDSFVERCVTLLNFAGDGIDLDWEHLSNHVGSRTQRNIFAKVLLKLRTALDSAGLHEKQIGFTTRHNAFWGGGNRPAGFTPFGSDGEGLDIDSELKKIWVLYQPSG